MYTSPSNPGFLAQPPVLQPLREFPFPGAQRRSSLPSQFLPIPALGHRLHSLFRRGFLSTARREASPAPHPSPLLAHRTCPASRTGAGSRGAGAATRPRGRGRPKQPRVPPSLTVSALGSDPAGRAS